MRPNKIPVVDELGAHLDGLLSSRFAFRSDETRIRRADELPRPLARRVSRLAFDCQWRAYRVSDGVVFVIGRCCSPRRGPAGNAAIEVYFLDACAAVYSAAIWEHAERHGWWQDSMVDLSYDSEQGWWSDGLTVPQMTIPGANAGRSVALLEGVKADSG